jgi:tetratricopeptide (TPR) repeat protein
MRFYPLLWVLLFLLLTPSAVAGTIMSRDDARECYLATLVESSSLADKQGLAACDRAASGENVSTYLRAAALANRADIRLRMHDYTGTIADADASIGLDPELAAAYLNRGAGLIGLQHYQDALASLDKAIALSLSDRLHLAYFNRGMARENLGDIRGAYYDYKKASELDPKFEPAREQLARFTVTVKR